LWPGEHFLQSEDRPNLVKENDKDDLVGGTTYRISLKSYKDIQYPWSTYRPDTIADPSEKSRPQLKTKDLSLNAQIAEPRGQVGTYTIAVTPLDLDQGQPDYAKHSRG